MRAKYSVVLSAPLSSIVLQQPWETDLTPDPNSLQGDCMISLSRSVTLTGETGVPTTHLLAPGPGLRLQAPRPGIWEAVRASWAEVLWQPALRMACNDLGLQEFMSLGRAQACTWPTHLTCLTPIPALLGPAFT